MTTKADEIWEILAQITTKQAELISQQKELVTAQKESERLFQESERRLQKTERILKQESLETERRFQETERILKQESLETERRFQETERILQESSQKVDSHITRLSQDITRLSKEIGNLGGKWGRFVENMVAPACETLFISRGISVHRVSQRVKQKLAHKTLEIDVLVTNENKVLAVEVKSSLGVEDIKEFVKNLAEFKEFFPEYNQKQLYGAVAGIEIEKGADKYAYKQGLFVLTQSGETVKILNDDNFQPKEW